MFQCSSNSASRFICRGYASTGSDGMIALVMALGAAPLRTATKFDVEALIGLGND
jgi:hypothetical protein